jgi:apolipoprotein N-acyltransferase
MFTPAVMQTEVEILNGETYYVRFGDWFAWTMTIIAVAVILFAWRKSFRTIG